MVADDSSAGDDSASPSTDGRSRTWPIEAFSIAVPEAVRVPADAPHEPRAGGVVVNVEAAVFRDGEVLLAERAASEDHAPGERALVGGKLEPDADPERPLEATVEREVREEVGVEIADPRYVCSSAFETDAGAPCVNVVFRARHASGEPRVREPDELASLEWVDPEFVLETEGMPPWTAEYVERAEADRRECGR